MKYITVLMWYHSSSYQSDNIGYYTTPVRYIVPYIYDDGCISLDDII